MKKLLLLSFCSLALTSSYGQQLSFGARTGFSLWKDFGKAGCENSGTWDKDIFFRRTTNDGLIIDASLGFYRMSHNGDISSSPLPDYDAMITEKSRNIVLNLAMQYDISCSFMKRTPGLNKLKSYGGVHISPTLVFSTARIEYREPGNDRTSAKLTTKDGLNIWTGVNHSFVYEFTPKIYGITTAILQVDPYRIFEKNSTIGSAPDTRVGFQIGLGYNL